MEPAILQDLLARSLSGDPLSADEQDSLLRELQNRPAERNEFLDQETIDTLLRCLVRLPRTRDDFVGNTLARIAAWGSQSQADQPQPPPIVVARPPAASRPAPRNRRPWRGKFPVALPGPRNRWAAAGVCLALAVLVACSARWLFLAGRTVPEVEGPSIAQVRPAHGHPASPASPRPPRDEGWARLENAEGATWDRPRAQGDRLAGGPLHLVRGTADLRFDKGAVVRLAGPATIDLRSVDALYLRRGTLSASVPDHAAGFTVITPVSRLIDQGSEFEVRVNDLGATETLVRRGRVALKPQREGESSVRTIELAAGLLSRASISLPDVDSPVLPVRTVARGGDGEFFGMISMEGQALEFRSAQAFEAFEEDAWRELRASPDRFRRQWSVTVRTSAQGASASAWVESDGQRHEVRAASPDADGAGIDSRRRLLRQLEELRRQHAGDPEAAKVLDDLLRRLEEL